MFLNLSKGSILYGLDRKGGVKLFTATVDSVSVPRPKYNQNTFGQLPEMVVDIVANINGERREFRQVPSNNAIADFGNDTFVLSDSKDSLEAYVRNLRQVSKTHIDNTPNHEALLPQYDAVLEELHPSSMNDSAVKALQNEVINLKKDLAEAISLLKTQNAKTDNKNGNS